MCFELDQQANDYLVYMFSGEREVWKMVNCGDLVKVAGRLGAVNVDQRASERTKTWF